MDTFLHCILIAIRFALALAVIHYLPLHWAAFIFAADFIYEREVIQHQTKHYDSDFRKGWDFWNWSLNKNVETWLPIVFLLWAVLAFDLWTTA